MTTDYERSLIGRQVEAHLGDEDGERVVARGQLLGFGQGGDFELLCDDGMIHYCWPMLSLSPIDPDTVRRDDSGTFGTVYQLWRGNVLVDTYAPWNGDTRPEWMTLADGS